MLKFNLTQEGKSAIAALQNNDKLVITHVRLLQSGDSPSVDLPISRGAIVVDGTCNGPYAVVDVNDTSDNHYLASALTLLSDKKSIAELYSDETASGYEVVLSAGTPGVTEYQSIKYRTQKWASGKIPSSVDIFWSNSNGCDVQLLFGSKGGDQDDPSQQEASARQLTLGDNFPKTIEFSNGDIWVTNETVSTTGVKNGSYSYGASSEDGKTSIRPLYSKISIEKDSNKQLKLRLSCQFDGAEKCKFNTTSINLPYATKFREGVVRFADPSIYDGTADGQRYNTVYSAADVDTKINQVTESLGNLDQYAKKAEQNEFTATNNTFANNITVNGEIGGTAVTDAGTGGDKHIVNVGYADNKYLSKTDASATYLTQTDAADIYLTKDAAGNYAKLNGGNTFTGATNTFQEVSATKFSGNGVSSAISEDAVDNGTKLPTCAAVKTYVDGKTGTLTNNITKLQTTLQEKDNDLQTQIDGINAGQNLADIVDDTTKLAAYVISHLKAKGDFQNGTSGATWEIGDKVQVLGGSDVQSSVYELVKGPMPGGNGNIASSSSGYYWRYIGVYGTNAYTKSDIDTKVATINSAIDTKADASSVNAALANKANSADVYSKTEADTKFARLAADNEFAGNNTFNGTISGSAVTSDIAADIKANGAKLTTSSGVSNFVTTVVGDKIAALQSGMSYLKLASTEKQTVTSSVDFNGTIGGAAVATKATATEKDELVVSVGFANNKYLTQSAAGSLYLTQDAARDYAKLNGGNTFTGATNTFQEVSATKFSGNGVSSAISEDAVDNGTKLPTCAAVATFVDNAIAANQNATSDKAKVGAMGLFLYTGGDSQAMGAVVSGASLQAVGMQLPMDGVVSWSQGAAMEGRWKLLNNTIAGEPCLVLAIRIY